MAAKPKKYAAVCANLPKLGLDPERQTVINAVTEEIVACKRQPEVPIDVPFFDEEEELVESLVIAKAHAVKALQLIKESIGMGAASSYAHAFAQARDLRDLFDAWSSDANLLVEALQQLMLGKMSEEGIEALKLEGGRSISTYPEPSATVINKEAFRLWCIQSGLSSQMVLPWQTTNALVKDRLMAGEAEPPGIAVSSRTVVKLSSVKGDNKGRNEYHDQE